MAFFDDDPNQPVYCLVKGSTWNNEGPHSGYVEYIAPMYAVPINDRLWLMELTSAHEEAGWKVG